MTPPKMPDDLYDCYLLYMKESKESILALISSQKNRDFFLKSHKPMSREKFEVAVEAMEPEQRIKFEEYMRTPYKERIRRSAEVAKQAIHEFQNNPEVQKRVAKECEEVLAKALKHARRK